MPPGCLLINVLQHVQVGGDRGQTQDRLEMNVSRLARDCLSSLSPLQHPQRAGGAGWGEKAQGDST